MVPPGSMRLLAERCARLWHRAARAPVVAAVLSLALVLAQLAVHQDEGSWVAKGALYDTAQLEGHFVEWEWFHVGETVALIEGRSRGHDDISSQNMYRFVGAYAISLVRTLLGGVYAPTVASMALFWLAAAWAIYTLGELASGSAEVGVAGAVMVASAPGFIAYFSNVDAHPVAYAGVGLWLALIERLGTLDLERPLACTWLRSIWGGLVLAVVGYTIEVAYPLVLFVWLFYVLEGIYRRLLVQTLLRLALLTAAFAFAYFGFRILVERVLLIQVVAFNEPFTRVASQFAIIRSHGFGAWLNAQLEGLGVRWLPTFPAAISLLAVVGAVSVPRRWVVWSVTLVGSFVAALVVTKVAIRELHLLYPAVYPLAAAGAGRIAQAVAGWCAPAGNPVTRARIRYVVLGALVTLVVVTVNADLWGNYSLPVLWFRVQ